MVIIAEKTALCITPDLADNLTSKNVKKLISISKMYVSSEKNFVYTNAICEQYLKLIVWAYAFKLINNKLHSTF